MGLRGCYCSARGCGHHQVGTLDSGSRRDEVVERMRGLHMQRWQEKGRRNRSLRGLFIPRYQGKMKRKGRDGTGKGRERVHWGGEGRGGKRREVHWGAEGGTNAEERRQQGGGGGGWGSKCRAAGAVPPGQQPTLHSIEPEVEGVELVGAAAAAERPDLVGARVDGDLPDVPHKGPLVHNCLLRRRQEQQKGC